MSEQFPISSGQIDPTTISEELLQQQSTIRDLAEGRISDNPTSEATWAGREAASFGLAASTYEVFKDRESPFGGGFRKFVSKEDPADTLVGISWALIAGNVSSPDRYIKHYALKPNGDIVGKVSVESATGISYKEYALAANNPNPKDAEQYKRTLAMIHNKAQELVQPPTEDLHGDSMSAGEATPLTRKGFFSKWLGRFSLR